MKILKKFAFAILFFLTTVVGVQVVDSSVASAADYWVYSKPYDQSSTTDTYIMSEETFVDHVDGYLMTDVKIVNRNIVRQKCHYIFQKDDYGNVYYTITNAGGKHRWFSVRGAETWAIYNKASELVGGDRKSVV